MAETPDSAALGVMAMTRALDEARAAAARGEVPVGAVVVGPNGAVLAACGNEIEQRADASAHAELLAMRAAAGRRGHRHLADCTLVATLEPCAMCAAAAGHFRIRRIVFGAWDPKGGAVDHGPRLFDQPGCLHRPDWAGGFEQDVSATLLRDFFRHRR